MNDRLTEYDNETKSYYIDESLCGDIVYFELSRGFQGEAIDRLAAYEDLGTPAELSELVKENANLRNELCLKCGKYHEAHNGACNGCRWKEI